MNNNVNVHYSESNLMVNVAKISPDLKIQQIVEVSEELFRRVGYTKTTIADIAKACGMSTGNVYRYFDNKSAINNAICGRIMGEMKLVAEHIVSQPTSASDRLALLFVTLHKFNVSNLLHEMQLHEMVEVAMQENWASIREHCQSMTGYLERIIADGVQSHEFQCADVRSTAEIMYDAAACILHPSLLAQCRDEDFEERTQRLINLFLASLNSKPLATLPSIKSLNSKPMPRIRSL